MTSPKITIQLSEDDAKHLLSSLRTTAMIAGDCFLRDDECKDGFSESRAIDEVDRFTGQLRRPLEEGGA